MSGVDETLDEVAVEVVDVRGVDEVDDERAAAPAVVDSIPTDVPATWQAAMRLAARVHSTTFVPRSFRGDPASVLACFLMGEELGLGPMQSLRMIDVIDGQPTLKAQTMRALVNRAGHRLSVVEARQDRVTLYGQRSDTGADSTVTWTIADAQQAKLTGNPSWSKYPRSMLLARATSELCRQIFSDIIGGLYTPDEAASIAGHVVELRDDELVDPVTVTALHSDLVTGSTHDPLDVDDSAPTDVADVRDSSPTASDDEGATQTTPEHSERPHDDALARRVHALIADTFPGATQLERDRLRHALCILVTAKRKSGAVSSSNDLDEAEQLALSDLLVRVQQGKAHVSIDRAGPVIVQPGSGWRHVITIDPPGVKSSRGEG